MDSFDNMMKAAVHIKSHQMSFDKKVFEKLPEFYKTGLYCSEMTRNVRTQKDFTLKKAAFDVHKTKGVVLIAQDNFEDAHYSFCKALCIFKYILNKNKNWKNEGVKDDDLQFLEDEGNSPEEKEEINKMKISAILNIALCDLSKAKFTEVRNACDEVLRLDPSNVKAYYRKAKSYLDCKSSVHEDYILANQELEKALTITPDNEIILTLHNSIKSEIERYKKDERKVFKSFFRNVNYQTMEKEKISNDNGSVNVSNSCMQITEEDANSGKPEIRILNLIIEQCYVLIDRLEREGNRPEMRKMLAVVEKARIYKEDLQKLLELNFEQPNEELKKFANKNNLDLNNPNVKSEFLKIRKNYLDQISKFYEDNLLKVNPQDLLSNTGQKKPQVKNRNNKIPVATHSKNNSSTKSTIKIKEEKTNSNSRKNIIFNFAQIATITFISIYILYFIYYNIYKSFSN